jgi:hypothetical protein
MTERLRFDDHPEEPELKCPLCGKWGAVSAGDTWCDHCVECHEKYFVWDANYGYCYSGPVPDSRLLFADLVAKYRPGGEAAT